MVNLTMSFNIERGADGEGIQTIRTVADVINKCNLRCDYCHPNFGWTDERLTPDTIANIFSAAEKQRQLEVTLTGGEITMHPDFSRILEATRILDRTTATFVTNATRITPNIVKEVRDSNVGRICVSLDGSTADVHDSHRGRNFDTVIKGLKDLKQAGKPITVISVAHQDNYRHLLELSDFLVSHGLADQHHLCAPSYSGNAKKSYDSLALSESQYFELQEMVDMRVAEFNRRGLYLTFNSFWPATGHRGASDQESRTMTLVQFTEQVKDIYLIVRPNGDVRLTSAAWGRETVGNAVVGNLNSESAEALFQKVDDLYRTGRVRQLPRVIEAMHKFKISLSDLGTDELIRGEVMAEDIPWAPIRKLSKIDLLANPVTEEQLLALGARIKGEPKRWRIIQHASGVYVVYDRITSHMTLLKPDEVGKLVSLVKK